MNKDGEVKEMLMNDNRNSKGDKKHLESLKNQTVWKHHGGTHFSDRHKEKLLTQRDGMY